MLSNFLKHLFKFNRKTVKNATTENINLEELPEEIDRQKFHDYLLLTKLYCAKLLNNNNNSPAQILRSTNPEYNNKQIFEFSDSTYGTSGYSYKVAEWTLNPLDGNNDFLIPELFAAQLSQKSSTIHSFTDVEKIKGKILIADFDETVVDGASGTCSEGFIDGYDIPPVDTWIYLTKVANRWRRLYSWVPEQLVGLADDAVAVNVVDCLSWLKE